jgi:hypothetical protein
MTKLAVAMLLFVACKSEEDYKKQKPPEPEAVAPAERKPPPPPPKKALTPEEMGKCTLKLSGALSKEQESLGGRQATNVSYWYGPSEQNNMMAMQGFAVNCWGPDIKFSIVPGGGKPDGQPFAPKKYEFKNGSGTDAGVNITLGPTLTFGDPTGTVNITAFDKRHIAGTIDLTGKLKGKGASGAVKLTGQFDFLCPGFSGCEL